MKGLLKGLATTLSTATRRPVTIDYPNDKHALPERQRSFPVLTWDFDHDEPFCTGCNVCVRNCPVDCMTAVMVDNPKHTEGTSNRRKIVDKFWIDYGRCMRCNICVEVCPFEAIVMDNNWTGHEHSTYDRRDLHMDIAALLDGSRTGALKLPFRPQDRIELIERTEKGEAPPEESFKGAKPAARQAQIDRIARGEGAAIQEREPEKPKAAAASAAGGPGAAAGEVEILSESKIRARRMRAERTVKELRDRGEDVPAELLADLEKYTNMKPGVPYAAGGSAAAAGGFSGEVLTGLNDDGSMRFPPGVGTGPKGDANSAEKVRARRTRAERQLKELREKGEEIPAELTQNLYDLGSDLAPNGTIWAALAGSASGPGTATSGVPLTGTNADGSIRFPPGVGTGPKGDPNSIEKARARRMRAERQFKELKEKGEEVPAELAQTLYDTGSDLAPNGTIWESLAGSAAAAPSAVAGVAAPAAADGAMAFPPGIGTGAKGDPNSYEKVRARRMRAERKATEATEKGEAVPDDVLATLRELGSPLAGGS